MQYLMGIDGGGSNLRVVITDAELNELVRVQRGGVNPNAIGRDLSQSTIQSAMREALSACNLTTVSAVGIGISGASVDHAEQWLRETVTAVLPNTIIAPASDNEIALVGGFGERYGLLILSGTGSIGWGVNRAGQTLQVGGWGFLLEDKGSGFWIGQQALLTYIRDLDAGSKLSPLAECVGHYLLEQGATHLVEWVYQKHENPVPEIAKLASVVLTSADNGDSEALAILEDGAQALATVYQHLKQRLPDMNDAPLMFAGGLLTNENAYSRLVMNLVGLTSIPQPQYEPVIGAALLARLTQHATEHSS